MIGQGSVDSCLSQAEVQELCRKALSSRAFDGRRVLAIIPDNSRSGPIDLMFRVVYGELALRVKALDFLIALGTHPPLSQEEIYRRVGITGNEHRSRFAKSRFFNHAWQDPEQLRPVGTISADELARISDGRMRQEVHVTINKKVFEYDLLMIIGPTFPHEVVGFSGGNKYFFPGISGQEIIDAFHWLGALIQSAVIIGNKQTPVRAVVDRAAAFLPMEKLCLSLVARGPELAGLFIGTPEQAFDAAADLSAQVHVIYKQRPFQKVLSHVPEMYDDLWTGAKGMYKLEPVVADGGELIIYAPHIRQVSVVHGELIKSIGYHVRDYFCGQMEQFRHIPGGVLAHSTHLRGMGSFEGGVERARINVTLASRIPKEVCRSIHLGYHDPEKIRIEEWKNREEEGVLYVPKAGEQLYRLKDDPFSQQRQSGPLAD